MNINELRKTMSEMGSPLAGNSYYAVTLLVGTNGQPQWSIQTQWDGFVGDDHRRELRSASFVDPVKMADLWTSLGQAHVVVNEPKHLMVFEGILGGNAIVRESVAAKARPEWIRPREVVPVGRLGFESVKSLPPGTFNRAPTPKLRMRVLNRDNRRCRICGRSPDNNTDIELHLHHIRPWGDGGVTHEDNLITLCHTCHNGLDPHHDPSLFEAIGAGVGRLTKNFNEEFDRGVQRYRVVLQQRWRDLVDAETPSS